MTKKERTAFVRILADLIKADTVIDEGEMRLYAQLKRDYQLRREDELSASALTLAEAIAALAASPAALREELLEVFSSMTLSDGFCAKQEAQLMMALRYTLGEAHKHASEVYSVYEPNVSIGDNEVVYVETAWDEATNRDIARNYRQIEKELRLAGFNFVYIPYIASHYKTSDPHVMQEVVRFLAPSIPEDQVPALLDRLQRVTTADYCEEQLCNRLGLRNLRDVSPSLLIKISDTYVGEKRYANFLRLSLDDDILPLCQRFVDEFCSMLSSDIRLVSGNEEAHGQFMYHGFYKQLFDIYVLRQGVKSRVLIDFVQGKILLPDLGVEVQGLHRRDKALYALLLMESASGGVNFKPGQQNYAARMQPVVDRYRRLYRLFNGTDAQTPDILSADIRRPIISNIRRSIARLGTMLHNVADYTVQKDSFGRYTVPLPASHILVRTAQRPSPTSLHDFRMADMAD